MLSLKWQTWFASPFVSIYTAALRRLTQSGIPPMKGIRGKPYRESLMLALARLLRHLEMARQKNRKWPMDFVKAINLQT